MKEASSEDKHSLLKNMPQRAQRSHISEVRKSDELSLKTIDQQPNEADTNAPTAEKHATPQQEPELQLGFEQTSDPKDLVGIEQAHLIGEN